MYSGSCLCGRVRFEIHGPIRGIVMCHCSKCRRAQGSAFATNGRVKREHFRFTAGEEQLTTYRDGPDHARFFCRHCGSPMLSTSEARPGEVRVRLGTIESDIAERPEAHIFVASKANWDTLCGDLPQYDEYEPDRQKP